MQKRRITAACAPLAMTVGASIWWLAARDATGPEHVQGESTLPAATSDEPPTDVLVSSSEEGEADNTRRPVLLREPELVATADDLDPWDFVPALPGITAMDLELQRRSVRYAPSGFLQYGREIRPLIEVDELSVEEASDIFYGRFLKNSSWIAQHMLNRFLSSQHDSRLASLRNSTDTADVETVLTANVVLQKYEAHMDVSQRRLRPILVEEIERAKRARTAVVFERGKRPPLVVPVPANSFEAYVAIGRWYFALVITFGDDPVAADLFRRCQEIASERDAALSRILFDE